MDAATPSDPRTERHLRLLQELAELGMDIARAVRAEAVEPAPEPDDDAAPAAPSRFGADLGLVFARIARAVRQTLALEARVAADGRQAQERRQAEEVRRRAEQRRNDVRSYVAQAIEAEAAERKTPDHQVERLLDDLDERLDDYEDALQEAPIGALVARICKDLGVTPDWSLWDDQDWALEHLRTTAPGDSGGDDPDIDPPPDPVPRPAFNSS
ncbi:MAG: hypothetical protein JWQ29_2927 [Phenylobacterium sp.]|nr:hypothetical protein [Phenylobacterium sp.]